MYIPNSLLASNSLEQSLSDSGDFGGSISVEDEEVEGLMFTGERENGRPVIKGGNIKQLVERLTYEKYNGMFTTSLPIMLELTTTDVKYAQAFMLTFRSFTSPAELLDLLIKRYNIEPPESASKEEIEGFDGVRKVVRLRFVDFVFVLLLNIYSFITVFSTSSRDG